MLLKKALAFAAVIGMLMFTSCAVSPLDLIKNTVTQIDNTVFPEKLETKKKIAAIMELIVNEDTDALLEQFSDEKKQAYSEELKTEIDEMYAFLDGKIVSYDEPTHCGYTEEATSYGTVTYYSSSPEVYNVETEGGQLLVFRFSHTLIDDKNPETIGLYSICIYPQKDGECDWGNRKICIDGKPDN